MPSKAVIESDYELSCIQYSPCHCFDRLKLPTRSNVTLTPFSSSTQVPFCRSHFSSIATSFRLLTVSIGYVRLGKPTLPASLVGSTNFSTLFSIPAHIVRLCNGRSPGEIYRYTMRQDVLNGLIRKFWITQICLAGRRT